MTKKPYLPSDVTEWMQFEEQRCEQCAKHSLSPDAKTQCIHLLRAFMCEDNGRWYFNGTGAGECTAFRSKKEAYKNRKRKQKVDKNQMDLFAL